MENKLSSEAKLIQSIPTQQSYYSMVQGECKIKDAVPLKRYPFILALVVMLVYTIFTLVIGLFLLKYFKRLQSYLIYSYCTYQEATHILILGNDDQYQIEQITQCLSQKYFFYRKLKYTNSQFQSGNFRPVVFTTNTPVDYFEGLSDEKVNKNYELYGYNQHQVQIPSFWWYMFDELTKWFFLLQYFICAVYIAEKNYLFAGVLLGFSVLTTALNYFLLRSSFMKIKEMAQKYTEVNVLRNSISIKINSQCLVPQDILFTTKQVPCDCRILSGQVYVNEVNLTGQNIPICKTSDSQDDARSWLYQGSTILESRGEVRLLVMNTGFASRKGRIIRKILHNSFISPDFTKNAILFLLIIFILGYIVFFSFLQTMLNHQFSAFMITLRALDFVGWTLPGAFPVFFNFCYSFSLIRLKWKGVFGTQPTKTVSSGKVKTVCFDKTGTLTENSMSLFSITKFLSQTKEQSIIVSQLHQKDQDQIIYKLIASCHSVRKISQQFMGDELDLRMFLYSEFHYQLSQDLNIKCVLTKNQTRLQVLKINQFQSKLKCMSVLVRDTTNNKYYVFVKGAAQKIQKISNNKFDNLHDDIFSLELAGLRTICLAYKEVNPKNFSINSKRDQFEKDLIMLGLLSFQHKLRDQTPQTIDILHKAQIKTKMITGDSIYIAIQTGIRSGMLSADKNILILEGSKQNQNQNDKYNVIVLEYNKVKSKSSKEYTLQQLKVTECPIAIDNEFFNNDINSDLLDKISIFSRISPENKGKVIRKLKQNANKKYKIAMCGDGANDLIAIKQADIGFGIADTDSSYAADFTSVSIKGIQLIIREGKATLMNVIEIYRYYGITNLLKITSSLILLMDNSYYTSIQITFFNYASSLFLALFVSLSGPAQELTKQIPNDNFLSLANFLTYLGHTAICTAGMIICQYYGFIQTFFVSTPIQSYTDWIYTGHTNTIVFITLNLFFITLLLWIYTGHPYKQPMYKNVLLILLWIIDFALMIALFFLTSRKFLGTVEIPSPYNGAMLGIVLAFSAVSGILWGLIKLLRLEEMGGQ